MNVLMLLAACLIPVFSPTTAHLSRVQRAEPWSFEKLRERADVVAIVQKESSEKSRTVIDGLPETDKLVPVETSMRVLLYLKGDRKETTLRVAHYESRGQVDGGIRAFEFEQREMKVIFERQRSGLVLYEPEYMIFLKARKDGRYECISQANDPRESIRLVVPPPTFREKRD